MSSSMHYLEHLTEADLAFLAEAAGEGHEIARLRREPGRIEDALVLPEVYEALFQTRGSDPLLQASSFLVFSVLVGRTVHELRQATFVEEWAGPGRRLPVFDVEALVEFAADSRRQFFLSELLTSYTHVASGSFWVQTAGGWRRRRYSELDPVRLAELLEVLPERERPGVYRRLGDLALFLSGVFPDHAGSRPLQPRHLDRIRRVLLASGPGDRSLPKDLPGTDSGALGVLEWLGSRSYRLAEATAVTGARVETVLSEIAEGFGHARRILNLLTDRHLFPFRQRWFGAGSSG